MKLYVKPQMMMRCKKEGFKSRNQILNSTFVKNTHRFFSFFAFQLNASVANPIKKNLKI